MEPVIGLLRDYYHPRMFTTGTLQFVLNTARDIAACFLDKSFCVILSNRSDKFFCVLNSNNYQKGIDEFDINPGDRKYVAHTVIHQLFDPHEYPGQTSLVVTATTPEFGLLQETLTTAREHGELAGAVGKLKL